MTGRMDTHSQWPRNTCIHVHSVSMPFIPSSFLFLVVRPGAPSSVHKAQTSKDPQDIKVTQLLPMSEDMMASVHLASVSRPKFDPRGFTKRTSRSYLHPKARHSNLFVEKQIETHQHTSTPFASSAPSSQDPHPPHSTRPGASFGITRMMARQACLGDILSGVAARARWFHVVPSSSSSWSMPWNQPTSIVL